MRLVTIESKLDLNTENELSAVKAIIQHHLIGENQFQIDSVFGKKNVRYKGEWKDDGFTFERENVSSRLVMYPRCVIELMRLNGNSTKIFVKCSLSIYWVVFLYFIYIFSLLALFLNNHSIFSIEFLKYAGGIILLNFMILSIHFFEWSHYESILKSRFQASEIN